jgi:hypothetical protein
MGIPNPPSAAGFRMPFKRRDFDRPNARMAGMAAQSM